MNYLEIESVIGREILDSRGNPTVEAEITLADGTVARGCCPLRRFHRRVRGSVSCATATRTAIWAKA